MLTPKFELKQNDDLLFVYIEIPYAKVSEVEVNCDGDCFMFYSKPYYLRLDLPAKVLCETPEIQYDVDKRTVTVKCPKAEPGEIFEGLDLLTSLNCKKKSYNKSPIIEIIGESNEHARSDEVFNLSIEAIPETGKFNQQCGFADLHSFSVFNLKEEVSEIFDVQDPQIKTASERKQERLKAEGKKFDRDYCLADLYDGQEIDTLLSFETEWQCIYQQLIDNWSESPEEKIAFTPEERDQLRALKNKEYLLDKFQVKTLLLGVIDILFAYCYDYRTTLGESTVESAWTVNKVSATLSWLEKFLSVQEVACSCIRRSLCYPLYRHFGLAVTVLDDVKKILLLGKKYVLKCLLHLHKMFCSSDPRYILNDMYITDYCIWIQSKRCSSNMFIKLGFALEKVLSTKSYSGLHLQDFEYYAYCAWLDHTEEEDLWKCHSSKVLVQGVTDEPENVCEANSCDSASYETDLSDNESDSCDKTKSFNENQSIFSETDDCDFKDECEPIKDNISMICQNFNKLNVDLKDSKLQLQVSDQ